MGYLKSEGGGKSRQGCLAAGDLGTLGLAGGPYNSFSVLAPSILADSLVGSLVGAGVSQKHRGVQKEDGNTGRE